MRTWDADSDTDPNSDMETNSDMDKNSDVVETDLILRLTKLTHPHPYKTMTKCAPFKPPEPESILTVPVQLYQITACK